MNNRDVAKKMVALVEGTDHVCYRYRLQAFEPYLNSRGWHIEAYPVPRGIIDALTTLEKIRDMDVLFLQRKLPIQLYVKLIRKHVKRLIFDFDDAVFRRDSFAKRPFGAERRRFVNVVGCSDVVIPGNDFLAQYAQRYADGNRIVKIPTCIEMETYERENVFELRALSRDGMVLVWIGSSSTLPLLTGRAAILDRVGSEISPIRLKVICDVFPEFQYMPVQAIPWSSETEIRELASSHVGISWLPEDEWGRGKCGLKVLQYMAAGLPVVANSFGVHLEMIEHGRSGFLADSPEDWVDAVRTLRDDRALARRMGERGREIVRERYSVSRWAQILCEALMG